MDGTAYFFLLPYSFKHSFRGCVDYKGDIEETLVQAAYLPSPRSIYCLVEGGRVAGVEVETEFRFSANSDVARSNIIYKHEVTTNNNVSV